MRGIEALRPDLLCSVLLLDDQGRLHDAAAPSLPEAYNAAIEGMPIGACAGSCGTAAWRGETVVVSDIALDPLWVHYRELALRHGLHACWSVCITASAGKVLGTFAAYYRSPRAPSAEDLRLLDTARHIAGIAIERVRAQEAVEQRERQLRAVMDSVPAMICQADLQTRIVYANQRYADWVGAPRDQLVGRPVQELVDAGTFEVMEPHLQRVLAGREVRYERRQRGARRGAARLRSPLRAQPRRRGRGVRVFRAAERRHRAQAGRGDAVLPRQPRPAHLAAEPQPVQRAPARSP